MAFPCLPPSTQQERELMQVNKHLNHRIATLESSLAAAEEATIRRCAAVCEKVAADTHTKMMTQKPGSAKACKLIDDENGSLRCVVAILALIQPKAEAK